MKMEVIEKPEALPKKTHFKFVQNLEAKDVLKLYNISKSFDRPYLEKLSFEVKRGTKNC